MKKRIRNLIIIMVMMVLFSGCTLLQKKEASESSVDEKQPTFQLYLCVELESNSSYPYDVSVNIDGAEIGTISDGETFSILTSVEEGTHEIQINKLEQKSVKVTKKIEVNGDMSFSCKVKHKKSSMEMYNLATKEGVADSSLTYESVEGCLFGRAVRKLNLIGFENIKHDPIIEDDKENQFVVVKESVSEGATLDKYSEIHLECMEINEYLDKYYKGLSILEVQEMADNNGFSLKYMDSSRKSMDEAVIFMNEDEKMLWKVIASRQESNSIICVQVSKGDE
jgi:hypothetical protein